MNENELIISASDSGQRLDKYLIKYFNKAPVGFVHKMLRKKRIKLNGGKADGSELLKNGDIIKFYISPETKAGFMEERTVKPAGDIDIVYEDGNVLIVNKPKGLLTHPESPEDGDTLIDRVLYYLYKNNEFSVSADSTFTPALCNRLDRNTSGVILCGKNLHAVQELNNAMAERKADKFYLAIVLGKTPESGELKGFHEKNRQSNTAVISDNESGKAVLTRFKTLKSNGRMSLLEVQLVTGRAHQIRAHLSGINHPIAGDFKYGGKTGEYKSQLLHAYRIVFGELTGELSYLSGREFIAPPDVIFSKALQSMENWE